MCVVSGVTSPPPAATPTTKRGRAHVFTFLPPCTAGEPLLLGSTVRAPPPPPATWRREGLLRTSLPLLPGSWWCQLASLAAGRKRGCWHTLADTGRRGHVRERERGRAEQKQIAAGERKRAFTAGNNCTNRNFSFANNLGDSSNSGNSYGNSSNSSSSPAGKQWVRQCRRRSGGPTTWPWNVARRIPSPLGGRGDVTLLGCHFMLCPQPNAIVVFRLRRLFACPFCLVTRRAEERKTEKRRRRE